VTAVSDPHGYVRLGRALAFVRDELESQGESILAERLARAMRFAGGSPSEYLGEAELVLQAVLDEGHLPPATTQFVRGILDEIDEGFRRVGGA
jgi:hypothetical protein